MSNGTIGNLSIKTVKILLQLVIIWIPLILCHNIFVLCITILYVAWTFGHATNNFPARRKMKTEKGVKKQYYFNPYWWTEESEALPRSCTLWHHQYGLSALIPKTSFPGETVCWHQKTCWLFSQPLHYVIQSSNTMLEWHNLCHVFLSQHGTPLPTCLMQSHCTKCATKSEE